MVGERSKESERKGNKKEILRKMELERRERKVIKMQEDRGKLERDAGKKSEAISRQVKRMKKESVQMVAERRKRQGEKVKLKYKNRSVEDEDRGKKGRRKQGDDAEVWRASDMSIKKMRRKKRKEREVKSCGEI